jgi:hypothetical protein
MINKCLARKGGAWDWRRERTRTSGLSRGGGQLQLNLHQLCAQLA